MEERVFWLLKAADGALFELDETLADGVIDSKAEWYHKCTQHRDDLLKAMRAFFGDKLLIIDAAQFPTLYSHR